jgi:hypothetical protein
MAVAPGRVAVTRMQTFAQVIFLPSPLSKLLSSQRELDNAWSTMFSSPAIQF